MGSRRKRQPPVVFERVSPEEVTLAPVQVGQVLVALEPRLADVDEFKRLVFADVVITRAPDDEGTFVIRSAGGELRPGDRGAGQSSREQTGRSGASSCPAPSETRVPEEGLGDELRELLTRPVTTIVCEMHDAIITLTPKGRGGIDITMRDAALVPTADDIAGTEKPYVIRAGEADDLLKAIGLMNQRGEIRAAMRHKFRQVNHFVELAAPSLKRAAAKRDRIVILDCGCGKSYLSFVLNYYLRSVLKVKCLVYGIDTNPDVIAKSRAVRDRLGYRNMEFAASTIEDFEPAEAPDVVMSLHACDLATDQAIAKGINLGAGWIFAVPCCQHELVNQIESRQLQPLLRHRLFKDAIADTVTDAVRTLIMEAAGYHVDVIEYVAPDVTPKNIMLRAEKRSEGNPRAAAEYRALKQLLNIDPQLESMIAGRAIVRE
jgi:hypothetical protein